MKHLITDAQWEAIKPIFLKAYPREAVVAIWDDSTWEEIPNIAEGTDAAYEFKLSIEDQARLLKRKPRLFLHSHPNGSAEPSDRDTESQIATGWNWGIVAVRGNPDTSPVSVYSASYPEIWGPDAYRGELLGRTFLWGIRDCWTLCTDWYAQHGIKIDPIPRVREPGPHHLHPRGHDPFAYWPQRLGFKRIQRHERQYGDLALMHWRSATANHCAIYLGQSTYLHQPNMKLSEHWIMTNEELLLQRWAVSFWRHSEKLMDAD